MGKLKGTHDSYNQINGDLFHFHTQGHSYNSESIRSSLRQQQQHSRGEHIYEKSINKVGHEDVIFHVKRFNRPSFLSVREFGAWSFTSFFFIISPTFSLSFPCYLKKKNKICVILISTRLRQEKLKKNYPPHISKACRF